MNQNVSSQTSVTLHGFFPLAKNEFAQVLTAVARIAPDGVLCFELPQQFVKQLQEQLSLDEQRTLRHMPYIPGDQIKSRFMDECSVGRLMLYLLFFFQKGSSLVREFVDWDGHIHVTSIVRGGLEPTYRCTINNIPSQLLSDVGPLRSIRDQDIHPGRYV